MTDNRAIKILMANGCSTWIRAPTRHNMELIYDFLVRMSDGKKSTPSFTYAAIAKGTGIGAHQVQFACQKMAFKRNHPFIKIFTTVTNTKNKPLLHEKVMLIRKVPEEYDGEED